MMQISIGVIICVGIVFVLTLAVTNFVTFSRAYDAGYAHRKAPDYDKPIITAATSEVHTYCAQFLHEPDCPPGIVTEVLATRIAREALDGGAIQFYNTDAGTTRASLKVIKPEVEA